MKRTLFTLLMALVLVLAMATTAFAGGSVGTPVPGKSYKMVTVNAVYPNSDPQYLTYFAKFYGFIGWTELPMGQIDSWYMLPYRDPKFKGISSAVLDYDQVSLVVTKSGNPVPTVKFTVDANGMPVSAVITAGKKAALFAPFPWYYN